MIICNWLEGFTKASKASCTCSSFMKEESVNENREIDKVYGDFESLLRDFEKEFISLSAQAGRANDNKADERIMIKTLKKHLPPLYSMVRSWKRSSKRD